MAASDYCRDAEMRATSGRKPIVPSSIVHWNHYYHPRRTRARHRILRPAEARARRLRRLTPSCFTRCGVSTLCRSICKCL